MFFARQVSFYLLKTESSRFSRSSDIDFFRKVYIRYLEGYRTFKEKI